MTTNHRRIVTGICIGLVCSVVVAGCGGSDSASVDSTTTSDTSVVVSDSMTDSAPPASSTSSIADDTLRIVVTVGVDSGPDRVENVKLNQQVELTLVNPKADDEFHLHGYDLGGGLTKAGEEKTFAFTTTDAGEFEVESHVSETVLVVLKVS